MQLGRRFLPALSTGEKKNQGYLIQEAPSYVRFKAVIELYKNSYEHNH